MGGSEPKPHREVSNVVARVLPVRNETVLVHVANVCTQVLAYGRRNSDEASKPLQTLNALESRGV